MLVLREVQKGGACTEGWAASVDTGGLVAGRGDCEASPRHFQLETSYAGHSFLCGQHGTKPQ